MFLARPASGIPADCTLPEPLNQGLAYVYAHWHLTFGHRNRLECLANLFVFYSWAHGERRKGTIRSFLLLPVATRPASRQPLNRVPTTVKPNPV
jgi:hypothetical protein